VPSRLHPDERVCWLAQQREQLLVPAGVLADARGLDQGLPALVHDGYDVPLRCDVDPDEAHPAPLS
jgi:hypothetical protein